MNETRALQRIVVVVAPQQLAKELNNKLLKAVQAASRPGVVVLFGNRLDAVIAEQRARLSSGKASDEDAAAEYRNAIKSTFAAFHIADDCIEVGVGWPSCVDD